MWPSKSGSLLIVLFPPTVQLRVTAKSDSGYFSWVFIILGLCFSKNWKLWTSGRKSTPRFRGNILPNTTWITLQAMCLDWAHHRHTCMIEIDHSPSRVTPDSFKNKREMKSKSSAQSSRFRFELTRSAFDLGYKQHLPVPDWFFFFDRSICCPSRMVWNFRWHFHARQRNSDTRLSLRFIAQHSSKPEDHLIASSGCRSRKQSPSSNVRCIFWKYGGDNRTPSRLPRSWVHSTSIASSPGESSCSCAMCFMSVLDPFQPSL